MFQNLRFYRLVALGVVALWFAAAVVGCAGLHHQHGEGATAQLSLNNGNKWTTDEPLRLGMTKIKGSLEPELPAIQAGTAQTKQYDALADAINAHVAYVVQNCKLDKQTDAMLHLVLADILGGVDAMQGKDAQLTRPEGARKIVHALENYGRYFDHPNWHAPKMPQ